VIGASIMVWLRETWSGRLACVTAEPVDGGGFGAVPFADATPAQVRAALAPEDIPLFDAAWQACMAQATWDLDLAAVFETLTVWRRTARTTTALGVDGYRRMLARAERTLATGQLPAGTVPVADVQARIAARLARSSPGANSEAAYDEAAQGGSSTQ
jgi:Family of unknown function (DUF6247)